MNANLKVVPAKNSFNVVLLDGVLGNKTLRSYSEKRHAIKGAKNFRKGPRRALVVRQGNNAFAVSAVFANNVKLPLGTYKRNQTALRGYKRFTSRLEDAAVIA